MHDLSWRERLRKTCLIMKLIVLLLFVTTLHLSASVYSQEARVTVHLQNASFGDVVKTLENLTNYTFLYRDHQVAQIKNLNLQYDETDIKVILDVCLKGSGLTYRLVDNTIVIQQAQTVKTDSIAKITVKGIVKDEKGESLPGVTIRVKGTTIGFVSNAKGEFDFDLPKRDSLELIFSFVGFKRQTVHVKNDMKPLTVVMVEDQQTVDEVVVTGIFNKPKESFTGAVTSVTKEELRANFSRNLLQTLANLDPALRIVQNNEQGSNPNALPEIQLRGASTLVDINDLQTSARAELNLPLFILDDFEVTLQRVMDLNEDDIANITILKDANATSLYGSRGANGVVVITSTRPEAGRLKVSYRGTLRLELVDLSTYDLLNAREKLDLEHRLGVWDYYADAYEELKNKTDAGEDHDWLSIPTRDGIGQNHVLSVMGGDDTWRFAANLSYDEKIGVMKGSDRKNFNGSLHISYNTKKFIINEVITVGANNNSDSPYGTFSTYVTMNPYWNPYGEDGKPVYSYAHPLSPIFPIRNPMYDAEIGCWNKTKYTNVRNSISLRYNILDNFYVTGSFGLTRQLQNKDMFTPPSHEQFLGKELDQKGRFDRYEKEENQWQGRFSINYTNTFNDKHMLTLNTMAEVEEKNTDVVRWSASGFINDDVDHPSMALGYPSGNYPNGENTKSRRVSWLFSGNYYYDMRYFLDFTYRVDGSSSFGKESRFAPFFSVGGGWTVSNESFMKNNVAWVSLLRLRASYGVSGNMGFTPDQAMTVYHISTTDSYLSGLGAWITAFGNPALKWQNTYQYNIGLDFNLLNSRLQFQFNYYNKETNNTVSEMLLPISHGFENCKANIGTIRNEGYELNVTATLIQKRDLTWNVTGRFSRNKNTVVKLSEGFKESIKYDNNSMSSAEIRYRYQEGRSMDAIYGIRTIGIDPVTGRRMFLTKDGKMTFQQNLTDMVYLGDRQPKINGSLSTSLSYKGLALNVGFGIRLGGKQLNNTLLVKTENASILQNLDKRVLANCWQEPGDNVRYKVLSTSNDRDHTNACDAFVQKDNVFECTNINLNYSFPHTFVKRYIGLESLSLGVELSDIFYISTIKRERGTSYPFSRNPNFTISCSF